MLKDCSFEFLQVSSSIGKQILKEDRAQRNKNYDVEMLLLFRAPNAPIEISFHRHEDNNSDSSYGSVTLNYDWVRGGSEDSDESDESSETESTAHDDTLTLIHGSLRRSTESQTAGPTRSSARLQSYTDRSAFRWPEMPPLTTRRSTRASRQAESSRTANSARPRFGRSPEVASQGHSGIGCTVTTSQGPQRIQPGQWYHMPPSHGTEGGTIDIRVHQGLDTQEEDDQLSGASQDIVTSMLQDDEQESAVESVEELPLLSAESMQNPSEGETEHLTVTQRRTRRENTESSNRGIPRTRGRCPNVRSRGSTLRNYRHVRNRDMRVRILDLANEQSSLREDHETTSTESEESESSSPLPSIDRFSGSSSGNEENGDESVTEYDPADTDASNF